jgi:predicted helicase
MMTASMPPINKIELNQKPPRADQMYGGIALNIVLTEYGNALSVRDDLQAAYETSKEINRQMAMQFEQLQSVVFARMVQKVGDRRYWEQWAKDVAQLLLNGKRNAFNIWSPTKKRPESCLC